MGMGKMVGEFMIQLKERLAINAGQILSILFVFACSYGRYAFIFCRLILKWVALSKEKLSSSLLSYGIKIYVGKMKLNNFIII